MPSIFGEKLFDDWFDFAAPQTRSHAFANMNAAMRTDIRETETGFELDIDLPGYKKDDLKLELKDGYLTINAEHKRHNYEKDTNGRYVRRERYYGSMSRSFYVGEAITEEDIRARFEDGILKLALPKDKPKQVEEKKYIRIE